ncbi:type II toxin-antitoxin system HicA family toxin [Synechococcus sp. PCC 6312]|uniref:type II toxin-antitoxin system HicA family toxin n=1 Tax=Synechococcus sp. (strain ATCC 27167 / PCC 6312) TaxID=195253 RepID=UPI00029F408F|nr:YcfA-like protein [Synechococcus sp. PCC 6312]
MPKKDKLLQLLRNSPNNARFTDICQLLELSGYLLDRITGSHHIFKKGEVIFVVPVHNKRVKAIYVRRVVELIEGDQE